MDGSIAPDTAFRRTLKTSIGCVGVGLHSGRKVSLTMRPAAPGAGIVFRRTDLGTEIPARWDHVVDTRLCTVLGLPGDGAASRVGTVEHVMAALAGCGVDDAIVEIDAPEIPILDGSAAPFVFLIDCAGIATHGSPIADLTPAIEILRPVRVSEGGGAGAAWAELRPNGGRTFEAEIEIDFPNTAIGRQAATLRLSPAAFRAELAEARTFTLAEDVARMRAAGLARGGSLANAIVVDGAQVMNPGGLRCAREFAKHKLLDVVGDLALAGAPLLGRFTGRRSGHALNNQLLRALFADRSAWRVIGDDVAEADSLARPVPLEAAPLFA